MKAVRKRRRFNMSHYHMTTMNLGALVPIDWQEVLPGDTMVKSTSALVRCSPLNFPAMHPVHVMVQHHYIPNRIMWTNFEEFVTGGADGENASVHPFMTMGASDATVGSLMDHLGLPLVQGLVVSALPVRAYQMVYNWDHRDQQLISPAAVSLLDGDDSTTYRGLQIAAWEKDYLNTQRLEPQLGLDVEIPLGTSAPVVKTAGATNPWLGVDASTGNPLGTSADLHSRPTTGVVEDFATSTAMALDPNGSLYTDLTAATAVQMRELRQLSAIQIFRETRNREGARYPEYTRSSFGVVPADSRLQQPELLAVGRQTIQFSEVLQTAPESGAGVGNLRGHGIATVRTNSFKRHFTEHGIVITTMTVRPVSVYQDGAHRSWLRQIKEDYFQPELERIGDQGVLKAEVYAQGTSADREIMGFNARYSEYDHQPSIVSGHMRTTLAGFHFARSFASMPSLNAAFINCVPPSDAFQATTDGELWVMSNHRVKMKRVKGSMPMPKLI